MALCEPLDTILTLTPEVIGLSQWVIRHNLRDNNLGSFGQFGRRGNQQEKQRNTSSLGEKAEGVRNHQAKDIILTLTCSCDVRSTACFRTNGHCSRCSLMEGSRLAEDWRVRKVTKVTKCKTDVVQGGKRGHHTGVGALAKFRTISSECRTWRRSSNAHR